MCTHVRVSGHTHTHNPCVGGSECQERVLVPLELELQVVVGCHWVLGIEHLTSARGISALKQDCLSSPYCKRQWEYFNLHQTHWSNLLEAMLSFHVKTLFCVFSEALSMSVNFIPPSVFPGYRTLPLHSHPCPLNTNSGISLPFWHLAHCPDMVMIWSLGKSKHSRLVYWMVS